MANLFRNFASRVVPSRTNTRARNDAYVIGDAIPAPHVIEDDPETAWALWAEAVTIQEEFFAQTAPVALRS